MRDTFSQLARQLLHTAGSDHEDEEALDLEGEAQQEGEGSTLDLRIAAVFVIMAAGLLGTLPPIFIEAFKHPGSAVSRITRAFAAGVILALAAVHIIPEAVDLLDQLVASTQMEPAYNVAGCCVLFGLLVMIGLEMVVHSIAPASSQPSPPPSTSSSGSAATTVKAAAPAVQCGDDHEHDPKHMVVAHGGSPQQDDPHGHACHSMVWAQSSQADSLAIGARDKALAYLFELGCIFHSFIIGISLGVATSGNTEVMALLIALSFHQCLEGLALGSLVVRARFSLTKALAMFITYSLTTPVGVAIGIAIADSYEEESIKALATQGVFSGLSAGMLLYVSLVQIVAEDVSRTDPSRALSAHGSSASRGPQRWIKVASFGALFLGMGCMAMLGVWA